MSASESFGIIGLGRMGLVHGTIANALSSGGVVAICEREKTLMNIGKKILTRLKYYSDPSDMMKSENLAGVFITTPTHTHLPIIQDVISINPQVAIFCEKPLSSEYNDSLHAVQLTRNTITMVGLQKRFSPLFKMAKKLLEREALGELTFFKSHSYVADVFRRSDGWRYRKGSGGVLLDLGPHIVDLLIWFFGEPTIIKSMEKSFFSEADDYVHAEMEFSSGLLGSMEVCWSVRGYRLPECHLEIHGKNGLLSLNDDYLRIDVDREIPNVVQRGSQVIYKASLNPQVDFLLAEPEYSLEVKEFIDSVKYRRECRPNFEDAAKINKVIDMIHNQAVNGI